MGGVLDAVLKYMLVFYLDVHHQIENLFVRTCLEHDMAKTFPMWR